MKSLLLVFIGGGLGSVVRFSFGRWVNTFHHQNFPWGTLAVNIVACAVLGVVVGLADQRQLMTSTWRLFWTVGFCGGFSTFSAFNHETLVLLQGGFTPSVILYVSVSILLCLMALSAGIALIR